MKGMILAGGLSTRLYPLTKQVPKPLVPIAGEPNAGHLMRYLNAIGIKDVAINIFYLAEKIRSTFGDGSKYGVNLSYCHERELSGSAGAVKLMESFFDDGTFVVVGCDALTNVDLSALIAFHRERKAMATIGLFEAENVEQFGVVVVDDSGRIKEFQEKPKAGTEKSKLVNTGIYIFEPEIFQYIKPECFYDFGNDVFPALLAAGAPFYGLAANGAYWADIGTISEYRRATEDVLEQKIVPTGARATGVPTSASVAEDAAIRGNVRVGDSATIEPGAILIGPSVIGDEAVIGSGALVERSIIFNGAKIGAGAVVRDSIVGLNYVVDRGATIENKNVAYEDTPVAGGAR